MDPLLLDIPTEIATDRLRLWVPRAGDGAAVTPLVRASLAELKPWMRWATDGYAEADGEVWARRSAGNFLLRQHLTYLITADGACVGTVGLHDLRWDASECEVGYWLGTAFMGRGYMTEAVRAVVDLATGTLGAARVVLQADAANGRSRRVAERCGFTLEGTFRRQRRDTAGELADWCVYALVVG